MRYVILFLISLISFSFKMPGSGTAHLSCKSESGRTVFTAELQDITGLLEKAELIVDGKKLLFTSEDEAYTIFDDELGVLTIYLSGNANTDFPNGRFIEFWAIPKTFKTIFSDRSNQRYEFKARIVGTEPRKGEGKYLHIPQVELNCVLEYKI